MSIPRAALLAAASLPENAASRDTLLRLAGEPSGATPALLSSQGGVGATRVTDGAGGPRAKDAARVYRCPVAPIGKPRQTQSDQWKQRPAVMRYRRFADDLREWADANDFVLPDNGCAIRFELPMPATWTKAKRAAMDGQPHQQTPDVDNLAKAALDALLANDCRVWQVSIEKRWAQSGAVVFSLPA